MQLKRSIRERDDKKVRVETMQIKDGKRTKFMYNICNWNSPNKPK